MRIRNFSFIGIRGLDGLKADWSRAEPDLVVVHGRPASGKTAFLDTFAAAKESICPYGTPDSRWDRLVGSLGSAKVKIDWELSANEQARLAVGDAILSTEAALGRARPPEYPVVISALLSEPGSPDRGSIHYLHDTRELDGPLSFGSDDANVRQRLTTRNSKFADLYDLLDQPEKRAALKLASSRFSDLFPKLEISGLRRMGTAFYAMVRDKESGEERPFETLSQSERQGFIFALYVSRMPIVDSVIFVDAPEIGMGDGAVDLIRSLLRWTTSTQIIVATGLDAVSSMPEAAHVLELPSS
jgi:hypothetical protein